MTQSEKDQQLVADIAAEFAPTAPLSIDSITDGAINGTYAVTYTSKDGVHEKFILQRLHHIFQPSLMEDTDAVTAHLEKHGLMTSRPLHTRDGGLYLQIGDAWWRGLTYLPGKTINDGITKEQAFSAGKLIGKFHAALSDFPGTLVHSLPHFHDTPFIMERLKAVTARFSGTDKYAALIKDVNRVLTQYAALAIDHSQFPKRVIHADLKIGNVRFDSEGKEAIALIDLDTLMQQSVLVDIGDALRSWCGINGEDGAEQVFSVEICKAALTGYLSEAIFLSEKERARLLDGVTLITLELAARFLTDAFEEAYFVHHANYPSLYEQNKTRGHNQLALLEDFLSKKQELSHILTATS